METTNKFLFEVSWEVCNKVGGIYTVLKSKLSEVQKEFGDHYILIGPLLKNNPEFVEEKSIELTNIRHKLQTAGIAAKIGRWNDSGGPIVVLVNYTGTIDKDKLLYELWEQYGVDSMAAGWDYVEPVLFATMAGKVIEVLSELYEENQVIAQFHEWMTGAGLLYLHKKAPHIATVFTTHATILGRSMAGSGIDIYSGDELTNPLAEAAHFNILAKYSMERISAREADCFTTVSQITAREAKKMIKHTVDQLLPNGFNVKDTPDTLADQEYFNENRKKLLDFASRFLQKEFIPENTLIISTSGRYEFHNKGIDVFIEALGELKRSGNVNHGKSMIAFFFVLAGAEHKFDAHTENQYLNRYSFISTHPLWNPSNDPIVNACVRNELKNNAEDSINIIFIPVYLDGSDGILNMNYYDALSGCDLTVYPSYYEPWGYTPLESISYSIPTVTTDLAGFGSWAISLDTKSKAVTTIIRTGKETHDVVMELSNYLKEFNNLGSDSRLRLCREARAIAQKADWSNFFSNYLDAYDIALRNQRNRLTGSSSKELESLEILNFRGTDSTRPRLRNFTVKSSIPKEIEGLRKLAYNIWYSWTPDAHLLFNRLDPELYDKLGNNPVSLLETIPHERLVEVANNDNFIQLYTSVMNKFESYQKATRSLLDHKKEIPRDKPVAYFSMEFGLHESLPVYSGGLGILSGDHMKSASDMNLHLVGVGLLYKKGYFKQGISKDGGQQVEYYFNDFYRMPVEEVLKNGKPVEIPVDMPGRKVYAKVWKINVGRIPVYMLDTSIMKNSPADREITAMLYGGGKKVRIEQEILLGIGGTKLLHELNISPSVFHLNEGHSSFLILERLINEIKYNQLDIDTAKEVIRASTVFTTHTPVPAGNETFDNTLVENYLKQYAEDNGLKWQEVYDLGHINTPDTGPYEMTVLALRNSLLRNGVSKLHGIVSRKMWSNLWNGFLMEEIPIGHITNGIHVGSWLSTDMKNLFDKYCQLNFSEDLMVKENWQKIDAIPDKEIWFTHINLKTRFFNCIKDRITNHWTREGEDPAILDKFLGNLTPASLTIGFARRFATYKRATMVFRDMERFKRLILNKKYPVQFIFAGKAHPDDLEGAKLIQFIVQLSKQPEFIGKIIFLENYDISLARKLVSSVDVWLNNPIRPNEASGTSGMKAAINGVLNFSVLDGWWDEAYNGINGWAIGDQKQYKNNETRDILDSESFYDTLESQVIDEYYSRGNSGIPEKWIRRMKNSIISIISEYNTHRMLSEYTEKMYVPAAKKYIGLSKNNFTPAKEIAEWKKSIRSRFSTIHISNISIRGSHGDDLNVSDAIDARLVIEKGKVTKEEITAQMIIIPDHSEDSIIYTGKNGFHDENITYITMKLASETDTLLTYHTCYKTTRTGKFNYGIRILPYHPDIDDVTDMNMVFWA